MRWAAAASPSHRHGSVADGASAHAEISKRVIIYHGGTGRTTFLAMLKLTSLLIGAFTCLIAVPRYIKADKPMAGTVGGS